MNAERFTFAKTLIGVGAVLVLAPLLSYAYLANRHQDRIFELAKDKGANVYMSDELRRHPGERPAFIFGSLGSFGVGATLIVVGLWGGRDLFLKRFGFAGDDRPVGDSVAAT